MWSKKCFKWVKKKEKWLYKRKLLIFQVNNIFSTVSLRSHCEANWYHDKRLYWIASKVSAMLHVQHKCKPLCIQARSHFLYHFLGQTEVCNGIWFAWPGHLKIEDCVHLASYYSFWNQRKTPSWDIVHVPTKFQNISDMILFWTCQHIKLGNMTWKWNSILTKSVFKISYTKWIDLQDFPKMYFSTFHFYRTGTKFLLELAVQKMLSQSPIEWGLEVTINLFVTEIRN